MLIGMQARRFVCCEAAGDVDATEFEGADIYEAMQFACRS